MTLRTEPTPVIFFWTPDRNPDPGRMMPFPKTCTLLLGSAYVLLREKFLRMRQESLKHRAHPTLHRLLISMGVTDPLNLTGKILETLRPLPGVKSLELGVVMGERAPFLADIRQQLAFPANTRLHVDTDQIAVLMAKSDLAIGVAGSSTWERCCLDLPAMVFLLADNQKTIAKILHQHEAAWLLSPPPQGMKALADTLTTLMPKPELLRETGLQASRLIRGTGTDSVCTHLLGA